MLLWIDPQFASAFSGPDPYGRIVSLTPADRCVLKQGRSIGRYVLPWAEGWLHVYIKKYWHGSTLQRWFGTERGFAGPAELDRLRQVQALGIRTATPLAAGADRARSCFSFFMSHELRDHIPLHEYIPLQAESLAPGAWQEHKRRILARVGETLRTLHAGGLCHRDFYLCHFFLRPEPNQADGFSLAMIDFTRVLSTRLDRWQIKDLAQLQFSAEWPGLTQTDRVFLFRACLGVERLGPAEKRLWSRVQCKTARYRQHNRKHGLIHGRVLDLQADPHARKFLPENIGNKNRPSDSRTMARPTSATV